MDSVVKYRLRLKLIKRAAGAEQNKVSWDSTSWTKIAVMLEAPWLQIWWFFSGGGSGRRGSEPSSISDLLIIQPTRSNRSSASVPRPWNPSRLKISDRSFYFEMLFHGHGYNAEMRKCGNLSHHLRSHSHFTCCGFVLFVSRFCKVVKEFWYISGERKK